jgi:hypothetical protein
MTPNSSTHKQIFKGVKLFFIGWGIPQKIKFIYSYIETMNLNDKTKYYKGYTVFYGF